MYKRQVLVPIQCEYYALEGLSQLIHTINLVKQRLNPVLELEGVVFTMYDARTNLSLQVVENVKSSLKNTVYKTIICLLYTSGYSGYAADRLYQ